MKKLFEKTIYGNTIDNLNIIHNASKEKKDGIYSFRGVIYRVLGGKFQYYAYNGKIMQSFGNFDTKIGEYTSNDDAKKKLKSIK